ncbi:MAG: hypothetical protein J7513_08975 [Solirubrobacteraceae bacterium]|nr:hypothetical protein [Solirubrobacteraceae bacterium]
MSDPGGRRGGWRIEFGPGGPGRPRGPRRPGGDGGDDGPTWPSFGRRARIAAIAALVVLLLLLVIFLRPLLHGPVMIVWRAPLPWLVAALILVVGRLASRRARLTVADLQAGRDPRRGVWAGSMALAGLSFFLLLSLNPVLVQRSIASHTDYARIDAFPDTGVVRLVPRDVAGRIMTAGFNSSTERLTDLAVVNTKDGLKWSAIRSPQGLFRRYTEKSGGLELQDAQDPGRSVEQVDAGFKYAPGLAVFDSLSWQLKERKMFADLEAPVGILGDDGAPLILVPYVSYTGFPIRRPKLGGAFLVHPDGRIEDLSPEEAAKRPEIARSGRLFPDTLARRIHDAYALKGGIWNYLLVHKDQTQIVDTEANRQPYLLQGPNGTTSWVSVAQPYGASSATTAIFLTDSTTGRTRLWKVAPRDALTGNARAVDIAEATPIAGISFGTGGVVNPTSGSFRASEPRPVFVKGKLYFIVSVVPSTATTVTKTIVVDAQSNRTYKVFDTDEQGLKDTLDFLENGPPASAETDDEPSSTTPDQPSANPLPGATPQSTTPASRAELQQQVERAIDRQQEALDELRQLREQLGATTP